MRGAILVCGLLLAAASPSRADEKAELDALIDRAIKAVGGVEELKKHRIATWEEQWISHEPDSPWRKDPMPGFWVVQWPDRAFAAVPLTAFVMDGDQGWMFGQGGVRDWTKGELAENKAGLYIHWVVAQLPLKEKAFTLAMDREVKHDERAAVGIRVSSKGHRDLTLFFDKQTALLVKLETQYRDSKTGKEGKKEWVFSDHKEVGGIKRFTRYAIKHDGVLVSETRISNYKPLEKLDERLFVKPPSRP